MLGEAPTYRHPDPDDNRPFLFTVQDENVLPALMDAVSDDPPVVYLEPWSLARVLSNRHYLPYTPTEMHVIAALEVLAIETGVEA